jgi:hypothetical protein
MRPLIAQWSTQASLAIWCSWPRPVTRKALLTTHRQDDSYTRPRHLDQIRTPVAAIWRLWALCSSKYRAIRHSVDMHRIYMAHPHLVLFIVGTRDS